MAKSKNLKRQWRLRLVRWHQRVGIVIGVLVLLLSITGILLNHTEQLALDEKPVASRWLLALYGIALPEVESYQLDGQWFHRVGDYLYVNKDEVAYCPRVLNGVVALPEMRVAACGDGLLLLTESGEVVERIGVSYGLPMPVLAIANSSAGLLLQGEQHVHVADLDALQWSIIDVPVGVEWSAPLAAPKIMQATLQNNFIGHDLNWERVILDIHSGRIASRLGIWLMDAVAVLMCFLSLSGIWVWFSKKKH
jgi:hypothetical protein